MKTHSVEGENEGSWKHWFGLHITFILHNKLYQSKNCHMTSVKSGENDMKTLVWT